MIENPILCGFCPDPSIIRAGEDYYIATSTFEWWPGVKLFHSKDLKHWEQITSPLQRYSQLNLIGDPPSGGVWAPCLSYDGKRFYLVYTDVKTKKGRYYNTYNYMVYTENIYGTWSEPIYLNRVGFDPSLFHDVDGRKYLINMLNGFKGIIVQEIDTDTLQLVGEAKLIYKGSEIDCTEGPHMYHIKDWYYLLVAEGGTGYEHCVMIARSKSIWGPFEMAPKNPILTSNQDDIWTLQKAGHADLVDTIHGEWYMVHLCSRPLQENHGCILGRETAIQSVIWDEQGWLQLKSGGNTPEWFVDEPYGANIVVYSCEEQGFYDDFDNMELSIRYSSLRINYNEFVDCNTRISYLRMKGLESLNSLHHVAMLAVRQQMLACYVETKLDFKAKYMEQLAGITYFYDAMNYYVFGKTLNEQGKQVLVLLVSDTGIVSDEIEPIVLQDQQEITLQIKIFDHGARIGFFYREKDEWIQAGEDYSTAIITDEHCRGFTGAHFGLYVHDLTGYGCYADFDYFKLCP